MKLSAALCSWLLAGCSAILPADAPPHPEVEPYLGVYQGSFDSALSEDPADDLNHNPCNPGDDDDACRSHHRPLADIYMKLHRDGEGRVAVAFYGSQADLAAGRALDLLGAGCGTRLGPLGEVAVAQHGGLLATFPLTTRNQLCLGKLRPTSRHHVQLELQSPDGRTRGAARVVIDKAVRDTNYLYVTEDGVRRRVKIDLDNKVEEDHVTRYRVCIENDLGEYERCVLTDREFRSFALPVPVPGGVAVNYTWWQELRPRLRRTQGRYAVEQYVGRFERVDVPGS